MKKKKKKKPSKRSKLKSTASLFKQTRQRFAAQLGNLANLQNAKFLLGPAEGAKLFKEGDLFVKELARQSQIP